MAKLTYQLIRWSSFLLNYLAPCFFLLFFFGEGGGGGGGGAGGKGEKRKMDRNNIPRIRLPLNS